MNTIVTGGAGFIGSHLVDALLLAGHEVTVIDDLSTGHRENIAADARFERLDIRDEKVSDLIQTLRPEAVFHHAAQADVRHSVSDPGFDAETNILGTIRLLSAARAADVGFFQLASTGGAIYGECETRPTPETTSPASISPYGVSKLCGEHYVDYFCRGSSMRGVSLRYGNVYGPRQDPHGEAGVVAIFSERMLRGQTPVIFGKGHQTRDYVSIDDVLRAILATWATPEFSGTVNIGTAVETNVLTLAATIADATGYDGEFSYAPARPGEQQRSCLDITCAKALFGWSPTVPLAEGLRTTVEWFRTRS